MMHEYAKGFKESGKSSSAGKAFVVKKFKSIDEVQACLQHYQEETVTHFVKYNRDKQFGNESFIPNVAKGRIHYWSHTGKLGKSGVPIEYDGVPFMHVGRWVLMCHQGKDVNKLHKKKYQIRKTTEQQESGVALKSRNRSQVTKKVDCPAEIYIAHIMKFPQYKVPNALLAINSVPTDHMRKLSKKRMTLAFNKSPKKFLRESWYYVKLPDPSSHEGHPILGDAEEESVRKITELPPVAAVAPETEVVTKKKKHLKTPKYRTKEPVDPRVLQKMYDLTRQGVSTVKMMQAAISLYVEEELFPLGDPPPSMYRRYNPTPSDIQNAMYKVKQEMRLEGKSILQYRCAALVREITELVVQTDSEDYLNQLEQQLRNIYNAVRSSLPIQQVQFKSDLEEEKNPSKFICMAPTITVHSQEENRPRKGRRQRYTDSQAELDAATYHLTLENQQLHRDKTQPSQLHQESLQHDRPERTFESYLEESLEPQLRLHSEKCKFRRGGRRKHSDSQGEVNSSGYQLNRSNQRMKPQKSHHGQLQPEPLQHIKSESTEQTISLEGVLENQEVHEIIQEDGTITEVYYYQPMGQYDRCMEGESIEAEAYHNQNMIVDEEDGEGDADVESPAMES